MADIRAVVEERKGDGPNGVNGEYFDVDVKVKTEEPYENGVYVVKIDLCIWHLMPVGKDKMKVIYAVSMSTIDNATKYRNDRVKELSDKVINDSLTGLSFPKGTQRIKDDCIRTTDSTIRAMVK